MTVHWKWFVAFRAFWTRLVPESLKADMLITSLFCVSFRLLGQNQVLTQGTGEETYDVPSVDWIHVQPGDRLALWEGYSPSRGRVGYSRCVSGEQKSDWGVFRGPYRKRADYSSQMAYTFVKYVSCRVFSYKAVIYPVSSPRTTPPSLFPLTPFFLPSPLPFRLLPPFAPSPSLSPLLAQNYCQV